MFTSLPTYMLKILQGAVSVLHALHKLAPMPRRYSRRSSTRSSLAIPKRRSNVRDYELEGSDSYTSAYDMIDEINEKLSKARAKQKPDMTSRRQGTSPRNLKPQSKKERAISAKMQPKASKFKKSKLKYNDPVLQQELSYQSGYSLPASDLESLYQAREKSSLPFRSKLQEKQTKSMIKTSVQSQGAHKMSSFRVRENQKKTHKLDDKLSSGSASPKEIYKKPPLAAKRLYGN